MRIKEAFRDTNKNLMIFLKHDHWELRLGIGLIKDGLLKTFNGIFILFRWFLALLAIPLMPIFYPIAIIIRLINKS